MADQTPPAAFPLPNPQKQKKPGEILLRLDQFVTLVTNIYLYGFFLILLPLRRLNRKFSDPVTGIFHNDQRPIQKVPAAIGNNLN